ncbi:hypothetical protein PMIN01_08301 [Paraphaeosphaeria minitans]|uniref:Uncharacterized protein n=1 Tax=Paraphaeosphaeria minitans TaxID=565426 RepID=A0A9P6KNT9_9PLEO|nr:hypothetical protein PMIN01_08301 [Paraphaeosphaeria minitans]
MDVLRFLGFWKAGLDGLGCFGGGSELRIDRLWLAMRPAMRPGMRPAMQNMAPWFASRVTHSRHFMKCLALCTRHRPNSFTWGDNGTRAVATRVPIDKASPGFCSPLPVHATATGLAACQGIACSVASLSLHGTPSSRSSSALALAASGGRAGVLWLLVPLVPDSRTDTPRADGRASTLDALSMGSLQRAAVHEPYTSHSFAGLLVVVSRVVSWVIRQTSARRLQGNSPGFWSGLVAPQANPTGFCSWSLGKLPGFCSSLQASLPGQFTRRQFAGRLLVASRAVRRASARRSRAIHHANSTGFCSSSPHHPHNPLLTPSSPFPQASTPQRLWSAQDVPLQWRDLPVLTARSRHTKAPVLPSQVPLDAPISASGYRIPVLRPHRFSRLLPFTTLALPFRSFVSR